jgi:hypothetical protein
MNHQKIGAWSFIITGLGHLSVFALMPKNPELVTLFESIKMNFLGERTALDYHNGFSYAMGILLLGFGFQVLFNEHFNASKSAQIVAFSIALCIFVVAATHFHYVAIALMALATIVFGLKLVSKN